VQISRTGSDSCFLVANKLFSCKIRLLSTVSFFMVKKQISSSDLSWLIHEHMRESNAYTEGITLAIIPDPHRGWRVILDRSSQKRMTGTRSKRLAAIEKNLRATYSLIDE
jgi:hypothetical protein